MGTQLETRVYLDTISADNKDEGLSQAEWLLTAPVTTPNPIYKMNVRMNTALFPTSFEKIGPSRENNTLVFLYHKGNSQNAVQTALLNGNYSKITIPGSFSSVNPQDLLPILEVALIQLWGPYESPLAEQHVFRNRPDLPLLNTDNDPTSPLRPWNVNSPDIINSDAIDIRRVRYKPWPFWDKEHNTFGFVVTDWLARDFNDDGTTQESAILGSRYGFFTHTTMLEVDENVVFKLLTPADLADDLIRQKVTKADVTLPVIMGFSPNTSLDWFGKAFNDPYGWFTATNPLTMKALPAPLTGNNLRTELLTSVTDTSITISNLKRERCKVTWINTATANDGGETTSEGAFAITITGLQPDTQYRVGVVYLVGPSQFAAEFWKFDNGRALLDTNGRPTGVVRTAINRLNTAVRDMGYPASTFGTNVGPGLFGVVRAKRAPDLTGTKYIKILTNLSVNNVDPFTKAYRNVLALVPCIEDPSALLHWFTAAPSEGFTLATSKLDKIQFWLEDDKGRPIQMRSDWMVELAVVFEEPQKLDVYGGMIGYTGPAVDFHASGDPGRYKKLYDEIRPLESALDEQESRYRQKRMLR